MVSYYHVTLLLKIVNRLAVQWLGLCAVTASGGWVPGQRSKIPQAVRCGQAKNCQWCCDSHSSNLPFQRWIPPTGPSVMRAELFATHFIYLICFLVSPLSHGCLFHFSYLSQHSVNYNRFIYFSQ